MMIELFFSSFATGIVVVLALIVGRDFFSSNTVRLFVMLLLASLAHFFHAWLPPSYQGISYDVQSTIPALFWFTCSLTFADQERPYRRAINFIAFYSFLAPAAARYLHIFPDQYVWLGLIAWRIPQYGEYLLVVMGLWEVVANWQVDLVESRRRLRSGMLLGVGIAIGWALISFNFQIGSTAYRMLGVDIGLLVVAWFMLRARAGLWLPPMAEVSPNTLEISANAAVEIDANNSDVDRMPIATIAPPAPTPQLTDNPPAKTLPSNDLFRQDLLCLNQRMESGFYRQENLTIAELAASLKLPEYRVRNLINQELGYRNFNEYINFLRIREAASRLLLEPETPVSNIALDVGYRTLSSFNRAFRKEMATTPTAFRGRQLP